MANKVEDAFNSWFDLHFGELKFVGLRDSHLSFVEDKPVIVDLKDAMRNAFLVGLMHGVGASFDTKLGEDAEEFFKNHNN